MYEAAVEGAYLNEQPIPGDEMVFQRTRVRIDCPTVVPGEQAAAIPQRWRRWDPGAAAA